MLVSNEMSAKKNVLLLISDDFNYWTNGYYPQVKTPNIDALGKKGVYFSDASCSSPVCNPSRNAFMSGLMPVTTGITDNGSGHVRDNHIAKNLPHLRTMNEHFTKNGYYTYAGGKIYHPASMNKGDADQANWSGYTTQGTGANGGSHYKWSNSVKNGKLSWSAGVYDLDKKGNAKDRDLAKHFANKIKNHSGNKPFFFACGFFRPHLAWNVHKQYFDRFKLSDLTMPQGYKANDLNDVNFVATDEFKEVIQKGKELEAIRAYLACLAYTDDNVGIVLDALDKSAHKDNTIVVFFGDHGWHLGEKSRYKKATQWDMAFRTTLIIYDPSMPGNGKVCKKVVSLMDIYPTLVELTGVPYNYQIEGRSIKPLLHNPNDPEWDKPIIMFRGNTPIIKTQKWRYVKGNMLYDVENDPYEWDNLINKSGYNGVISDLESQITKYLNLGKSVKKGGKNNEVETTIANPCTDPPSVAITKSNATCGSNNGSITFTFADASGRSAIELSIDGGSNYTNVADNSGSYTFTNLSEGTYNCNARWRNGDCPTNLGNKTISCTGGNEKPIAEAGPNQTVTISGNNASIILDGSGSIDNDGTIESYVWTIGSTQIATGISPSVSFAVGTHTVTLTVTDNEGASDNDEVVITINDGNVTGPVSDGVYFMKIRHSNKYVEVANGSNANGGNVRQWKKKSGTHKKWEITGVSGEWYKIVNVKSGKAMEVAGNSTANGGNIQQWNYNGTDNQLWKFIAKGSGWYQVESKLSGKVLDIAGGVNATQNGKNIQQWKSTGKNNQQFKLQATTKSAELLELTAEVKIYPNPASSVIHVELGNISETATIQIYNLAGQLKLSTQINNAFESIDISNLSKGAYFIQVSTLQNKLVRNIIIE